METNCMLPAMWYLQAIIDGQEPLQSAETALKGLKEHIEYMNACEEQHRLELTYYRKTTQPISTIPKAGYPRSYDAFYIAENLKTVFEGLERGEELCAWGAHTYPASTIVCPTCDCYNDESERYIKQADTKSKFLAWCNNHKKGGE